MYHKPVCVECEVDMRPFKNGVALLDMALWGPYKIWEADLWQCPICGHEVIVGFGEQPIYEHYQEGFEDWVKSCKEHNRLYYSREQDARQKVGEAIRSG